MTRRKLLRRLRAIGPTLALVLVLLVGGISVWQAWDTARHMRSEARDTSRIFGRVVAALSDTTPGAGTELLFELVSEITATGIPLIVTDSAGRPTASENLGFDALPGDPRLDSARVELARYSDPIVVPRIGRIYFGPIPAARRLSWMPLFQVGLLAVAVLVALWAFRNAVGRDRERLWVAMARESAHQLGTPLMSARAWVERLREGDSDLERAVEYLGGDIERLERVAQRFERIGRPARRDSVALGAMAERVAAYFRPRLPRHANKVSIEVAAPGAGPFVGGDQVLLEWALESLVRNSIDALSGKGGKISIQVSGANDTARLVVADNGPGIAASVWGTIFEPGVSTKSGGWGIGLPLARRIVEDVHQGRLTALEVDAGAAFEAVLPVESE